MRSTLFFAFIFLILLVFSCKSNDTNNKKCQHKSEWRDNNGLDSCSFYSSKETCTKIIGKLNIKSRLHKNKEGVFEGGISSRWLVITKDSIIYFSPTGEVADRGKCKCEDGKLTVNWAIGDNLPEKAIIHFNNPKYVELRYYDYPFSFNRLEYDSTKTKSNPTKIIGEMN
jgi:hypothetical protein